MCILLLRHFMHQMYKLKIRVDTGGVGGMYTDGGTRVSTTVGGTRASTTVGSYSGRTACSSGGSCKGPLNAYAANPAFSPALLNTCYDASTVTYAYGGSHARHGIVSYSTKHMLCIFSYSTKHMLRCFHCYVCLWWIPRKAWDTPLGPEGVRDQCVGLLLDAAACQQFLREDPRARPLLKIDLLSTGKPNVASELVVGCTDGKDAFAIRVVRER